MRETSFLEPLDRRLCEKKLRCIWRSSIANAKR